MANEKPEPVTNFPTVRSPQFRSVYINHASGGVSNWDLHFTFGVVIENAPGQPAIEEQIMMMMTYDFAKAMVSTFNTGIQAYESAALAARAPQSAQAPTKDKKD